MKRRQFLAASAIAAGTVACSSREDPKPDEKPLTAEDQRNRLKGVQVLFHGLNLFAIPTQASKKAIDVGFINTRLNPEVAKHVQPHVATLRVNKDALHPDSDALPVASDPDYAYYALTGLVTMVVTSTPSTAEGWNEAPSLKWKDTTPGNLNPPECPRDKEWKTLGWLLDFKHLFAKSALPNDWPKSSKFTGVLSLRSGELETDDVPEDSTYQYTYVVEGKERIIKEIVRCYVKEAADFVQFKFGDSTKSTSVILPCKGAKSLVMVDVFHLPTPGIEHTGGPLGDYWALYRRAGRAWRPDQHQGRRPTHGA